MNIALSRPVSNGLIIAAGQSVIKHDSWEESLKDGAIMGVASVVSQMLVNKQVANFTPSGTSLIFSDGITYALLEAIRKSERTGHDIFYNFVEGSAASFVTSVLSNSIIGPNPLEGVAPNYAAVYSANANNIGATNTSVAVPIVAGANTPAVVPPIAVPNPSFYASL